jgi:nicotinamidase-related amidase
MMERMGREEILARLFAGSPDRALDALVTPSPVDASDLVRLRGELVELASSAPPVLPSPGLRARLLATRPRPRRPRRPVFLVVDMIVDHLTPGCPLEVPRARDIVPALQGRLAQARSAGVPVVYVCDHHAPDDPDLLVWPSHAVEGSGGGEVWPDLAPMPGDHVVQKPTYSAFNRSSLGPLLEELRADQIILTGCATEMGLQATAVDALQRGYVVTIPPDSQAGMSALVEGMTLLTLSAMPPYDPIYLR